MNMIGQDHHRVDFKRKPPPRLVHGGAMAVLVDGYLAGIAVKQIDREKVCAAWNEYVTIAGHVTEYPQQAAQAQYATALLRLTLRHFPYCPNAETNPSAAFNFFTPLRPHKRQEIPAAAFADGLGFITRWGPIGGTLAPIAGRSRGPHEAGRLLEGQQ